MWLVEGFEFGGGEIRGHVCVHVGGFRDHG